MVESTDLGMAGAVLQGGEAHISTGTFQGQLAAAAARRAGFQPSAAVYHSSTMLARQVRSVPAAVFHREPGPGVAYANIVVVFWRLPGPVGVVLVGPQLPDGVMAVHGNDYRYSALHHRPGARRGVVLADLLPSGAGVVVVYSMVYVLQVQPRPGAGHGDVLGDLFPITDGGGHGEVSVGLLPGGVDAVYDDYGYYPWQPRLGAGRGEVFNGPLPDGVGVVFVGFGNFAQRTLHGTVRVDGLGGMLRGPNLGAEHDGSRTLAYDLGAVYDDRGMAAAEHLRRLLALVGIGACSVAVNALAASPSSPAVAFHVFVLFLAGLFLVILHVLGV